ncbi:enoyl-CoA hydratase-related protein [Parvularcula marina]|uniref:Enoyl-CoA hydratase n=1 Tax=Parvularcula marina TaxID=2292771 RepID=A0A371RKJ1_9PROT|nr:enoyl-CoA hydratase-related protein [Parvularcula marina]RFB05954.1 enoyl-CoA hydratase [Parvularcula marina]
MTQQFTIETDGPVATLTLDRAEKRNALALPFWEDFPAAIEELDKSGDIRAIVIAANGPLFCAGIDLSAFAGVAGDRSKLGAAAPLDFIEKVGRMQRTFTVLEEARVPVIAAIHGKCLGAGVDMITACDIRLATKDAAFSVYEIHIGMTADVGTFPRLLNHLPEGLVRELAYTGREMGAEEALRYGLVNHVHETHEDVISAAQDMARDIATKAPMAVHGCKRAITYSRDHKTKEALDYIGLWNASMLNPSELMTAAAAKQSGQPGQFAKLPQKTRLDEAGS